jgi:hypothetical protein
MSKVLYRATSGFGLFLSLMYRGGCIFAIVYLAFNYRENPVVISIAALFFLYVFLAIGNDTIIVHPDRFVQKDDSILSLFLKRNYTVYNMDEIAAASLQQQPVPRVEEIVAATALIAMLPIRKNHADNDKPIYLYLKNGKTATILTSLEETKRLKIVALVNSLTNDPATGN